MYRRAKVALVAASLTLITLFAVLVQAQLALADPLAKFRMPDGGVSIPGPAFTRELQELLFPPPAATTYTVFAPVHSAYPTLEIRGHVYDMHGIRASQPDEPPRPDSVRVVPSDVARTVLCTETSIATTGDCLAAGPQGDGDAGISVAADTATGEASSGAGTETRDPPTIRAAPDPPTVLAANMYLVLNDGGCTTTAIATDADCWSGSSGGAGGAGVPVAGDNVFMDASSGVGTGTLDAVMDITTGTFNSTGFAGTFNLGRTFINSGTFTHAGGGITAGGGGNLDVGPATVSANITDADGAMFFDGLTLSAAAIDLGIGTSLNVEGNLVMTGGDIIGAGGPNTITGNVNISSASSAIDFGFGDWTISGTWTNSSTDAAGWDAGTASVTFDSPTGGTMTFAGTNLGEAEFFGMRFASSAVGSQTFTMATRGLEWSDAGVVSIEKDTILSKGTLTLTGGHLSLTEGASALTSTSGDVNLALGVSIIDAASYINFGSETWTVSGAWTNSSQSLSWDAGTGTVLFDSATGATMAFGDGLGEAEFNNLTFSSSAGTPQTFTAPDSNLWFVNTLTVTDSVSTTEFVAPQSFGNEAAVGTSEVVIGNGGIVDGNGSGVWQIGGLSMTGGVSGVLIAPLNLIVNGSWDTSGAGSTFVQGTEVETVRIGLGPPAEPPTATITMLASDNDFNRLRILSATVTLASDIDVVGTFDPTGLRIASGILDKATYALTVLATGSQAVRIQTGSSIVSTSGDVTIAGAVNIESTDSFIDFGSETWTISGEWTNDSTSASWDAGDGRVIFTSATGGTMTFAGANLAEPEFNNVTFSSSGGTAQTFTMATRGLQWGIELEVSDSSGGTILAKGTQTLTGGSFELAGPAGGAITSTSGDVTLTGTVNVNISPASYIDFGSETWTVGAPWGNNTTSSLWDAGTGTVIFTSATDAQMRFAGANLSEAEFNNVTFNSTSVSPVTITIDPIHDLRLGGTLTISDTVGSTTLATGTFDLRFVSLVVGTNGILSMNSIAVTDTEIETNSGDITLTQWNSFTLSPTDVRWTFDPSSPTATITTSLSGLASGDYTLRRDGVVVQAATAVVGTATFSVTGGWSPHTMQISRTVTLAVHLTGEFDYLLQEDVRASVASLVTNAETGDPASGATVTIRIYNQATTLLITAPMIEVLPGTGIYQWTSTGTLNQLNVPKGVYLVVVEASLSGDPITRAILEVHVDPPAEGSAAQGFAFVDMVAIAALTAAVAAVITGMALRRREVAHAPSRLRKHPGRSSPKGK